MFRHVAIQACMQKHLSRRANVGYHLWGLMILFLWMKRWRIHTAPVAILDPQTAGAPASI